MLLRNTWYSLVLVSVAALPLSGCASKEVLKKDEGPVPATSIRSQNEVSQPVPTAARQSAATATPHVTASTPAAVPVQQGQKVSPLNQLQSSLEKIFFDFDSATLSDASRKALTKNAVAIQQAPGVKIRIEGNCDERGSSEYNLALGERRAKAAQQYMVTLGVKPEQVSIISYGKEKPAVRGSDETAMAKNRRDEFTVITK